MSKHSFQENSPDLFRRFASSFLGLIHSHLGVCGIEVEEMRERLLKSVVLIVIGAGAVVLGLLTLILAIALMVDAEHRLFALFGLLLFFVLLAFTCLGWVWRDIRKGPRPFAATIEELRRDRESLLP